jgi:hypothetical protein
VADEPEDEAYELTNDDWGKIHAKAWGDEEFRKQLEQNPTAAVTDFLYHKFGPGRAPKTIRIVKLRPRPDDVPEEFWEDVNPFPPSCC